jgi:hypothetical protein
MNSDCRTIYERNGLSNSNTMYNNSSSRSLELVCVKTSIVICFLLMESFTQLRRAGMDCCFSFYRRVGRVVPPSEFCTSVA